MAVAPIDDEEMRFRSHVTVDGEHWLWKGELNNTYPRFTTADGEPVMAMRWAYEHWVGPIDIGRRLARTCSKRLCVYPWHATPLLEHARIPFSFSLTAQQAALLRSTRRSWAWIIEEAMTAYYPTWPHYPRDPRLKKRRTRPKRGASVVHIFLLTDEQRAWFDRYPKRPGRNIVLIEDALAAYFESHYSERFPRAPRAARSVTQNDAPGPQTRGQ